MKIRIGILALALLSFVAQAAQDTALTNREVRDPKQLEPWLEANAADAQARLASLEASTNAAATVSNLTVTANATIAGTLGVTGAATLTGNAIANELDARTATALLLGKATATSVAIGASDAGVTVPGTLGVTGVATFTAAPKFTATTAAGAVTLTATNGPAVATGTAASPVWITVTIGAVNYVVPAWQKQ